MNFVVSFVFSLIIYLGLTVGSGDILYWSKEEIILGVILSTITGLIVWKIFNLLKIQISQKFLNPFRYGLFLIYIFGPFLFSLIKANLEVAYRIITKKIKPGIIKISPNLKTDFGITLLANFISLTPGTLSVDVDQENNLYIHWLYVKNNEPKIFQVAGNFTKWIKIITE
ncbi:MAG: cation:proton antiporter [Xanthomonadaceae bacterium]|nr:cation:proton antiporter [Rhodospirillaceae bacterium]NIA17565.1 cation:proton antiporter [Xanthomonadaceae bacterium]